NEDESRILSDICDLAAAVASKWNARNIDPVDVFVTRLPLVLLHAQQIHPRAFAYQRLGRPTWPRVSWVIRKQENANSFALKSSMTPLRRNTRPRNPSDQSRRLSERPT